MTDTEAATETEQVAVPVIPPSIAPLEVSDELAPRIDALDLWPEVEGLRTQGYTVVRNVAPPELLDELREAIHALAQETEGPIKGLGGSLLLGRHPAVDKVATLPKILALAEFSVGQGFRAGQFISSIMAKGGPGAGRLHADQSWLPSPFPAHNCVLTFCVPCEGMTAEGGATRVVPGSREFSRQPTDEELESVKAVAIEVDKGSCAVWDGSVWHSGGFRTIPGERTMLHASYQRLYTQPLEDYSHLLRDEEYMAHAPEGIRSLLGADLPFGTSTATSGGLDMMKFMRMAAMSKR